MYTTNSCIGNQRGDALEFARFEFTHWLESQNWVLLGHHTMVTKASTKFVQQTLLLKINLFIENNNRLFIYINANLSPVQIGSNYWESGLQQFEERERNHFKTFSHFCLNKATFHRFNFKFKIHNISVPFHAATTYCM